MSVYTVVSPDVCVAWLKRYDVGQFKSLEPIAAGIENTNYFLTTDKNALVLTIYERVEQDRLAFSLAMMQVLSAKGVLCPIPQVDCENALFSQLLAKPAGLVSRLKGKSEISLNQSLVAQAAENLAHMHLAAETWPSHFPNPRGQDWRDETAESIQTFLTSEQYDLLDCVLNNQIKNEQNYLDTLPQGAIHADYFHDNVLFEEGRLTGVIDFGFAGCDAYAYDLAIAVNDWCWSRETHQFDKSLYKAFMTSYANIRPLRPEENKVWFWLLERAALRFWLSRLYDLYLPREGALVHAHDPAHFERILRYHREGDILNRMR
ncbi:MAG: homoserine kinase [Pseudomonadota bacterium]